MNSQQRRMDDPYDPWMADRGRQSAGAGSLFVATLLGVGIGLLAAPQPGSKTRTLLRKRFAALGEGMGESLEEAQEAGSKARKRARQRLARLRDDAGEEWEGMGERWERAKKRLRDSEDEDDESGALGTLLALVAGVAATYVLTSDRAAPVRSRVQEAATDVRRRATDQWDRFQRGGLRQNREAGANQPQTESRTGATPPDDVPGAN
jgi:gas vesicle protein